MPKPLSLEERAPGEVIDRQASLVKDQGSLNALLDANPSIVLVLNQFRQVVYANQSLARFLKLDEIDCVFGLRPGEVLSCVNSDISPGGCGNSEFCKTCGALNAILSSQEGNFDIQECRITRKETGDALDLRVWATPHSITGEHFTIFAVQDVSHEKRRGNLERIFFHDVLNTAGNLRNYAVLLKNARPEELPEYAEDIQRLSEELIDVIQTQREITRAENGDLIVKPELFKPAELVEEIAALHRKQETFNGIRVIAEVQDPGMEFITDPGLLRRILLNIVKNAVEASQAGETVSLECRRADEQVIFRVHNPAVMPEPVRLQVFQRSFSTKGAGRGLGTYGARLLGERYLGGTVSFTSEAGKGTQFVISLPYITRIVTGSEPLFL
jgi:PAS domain-containing protein